MLARIKRIIIVTALSLVVALATGVLSAAVASPLLGSTIDASGQEKLKGGAATTLVIVAVCVTVSIIFATWLNKLLNKMSKIKE